MAPLALGVVVEGVVDVEVVVGAWPIASCV